MKACFSIVEAVKSMTLSQLSGELYDMRSVVCSGGERSPELVELARFALARFLVRVVATVPVAVALLVGRDAQARAALVIVGQALPVVCGEQRRRMKPTVRIS